MNKRNALRLTSNDRAGQGIAFWRSGSALLLAWADADEHGFRAGRSGVEPPARCRRGVCRFRRGQDPLCQPGQERRSRCW